MKSSHGTIRSGVEYQLTSDGLGWRQFKAVMKKNLLMKRRKPVDTLLELFSPLLFTFIVVSFFNLSKVTNYNTTVYASKFLDFGVLSNIAKEQIGRTEPLGESEAFTLFNEVHGAIGQEGFRQTPTVDEFAWLHNLIVSLLGEDTVETAGDLTKKIGYPGSLYTNLMLLGDVVITPDTPETHAFSKWMNTTYRYWRDIQGPFFNTIEEAQTYALNPKPEGSKQRHTWAHMHFDALDFNSKRFEVRIRMIHSVIPNTKDYIREFALGPASGGLKYLFSGFLSLQRAVELYTTNSSHLISTNGDLKAFANRVIAQTTGIEDSVGMAEDAADMVGDIWENKYFRSVVPTDEVDSLSAENILEGIIQVTGAGEFLKALVKDIEDFQLPPAPYAYSFGDDWSAPFPTMAWEVSDFFHRFGHITGLLLSSAMIYPISQLILVIVQEKEIRMKEMMKMMGLREWVFHVTWLATYFVMFLIQSLAQAAYLCNSVFGKSSFSLILVFFMCFNLSLLSMSFMISTFFNRAKLASMIGPVVVLSMVLPAYVFTFFPSYEFVGVKKFLTLLSPSGFAFGIDRITSYERSNVGLNWSNMDKGAMPFSFSLGMLFFDFLLYGFFAWYFDKVLPTKYGSHRHPLFVLKPAFWSGLCRGWYKRLFVAVRKTEDEEPVNVLTSSDKEGGDKDKTDIKFLKDIGRQGSIERQVAKVQRWDPSVPSIEVKNLTKKYAKNGKKAVDNVSFEMMHGEVSCLLGSNGAGKSTTISMLTGLYEVSSGDSYLYGDSIVRNISDARKIMGVCPQHNVLYPDLTVLEHLEFFAALKGMKEEFVATEVFQMIEDLELVQKTHAKSKTLSGGQKRKLSLGIALLCHSKIVFLDEPTAGMDPQARRAMWNLILRSKKNRTIVLTTHHLEEADLLGDRICIMKDGKLIAAGDPLELKLKYGLGYVLTIVKEEQSSRGDTNLETFVTDRVPGALLLSNSAGEISFQLPSDNNAQLVSLFTELEKNTEQLNIRSYGVNMTSLEDVFLTLCDTHDLGKDSSDSSGQQVNLKSSLKSIRTQGSDRSWEVSNGNISTWVQFKVLIFKRWRNMTRDKGSLFHEVIMPILLLTSVLFVLSVSPQQAGPPMLLRGKTIAESFKQDVLINSQVSSSRYEFPNKFAFQTPKFRFVDPMQSPYFDPTAFVLQDHDCGSSICLSYRNLIEEEQLREAGNFNSFDKTNAAVSLCAYKFEDKAFLPLNLGDISGITDETRDGFLDWFAQQLGIPVDQARKARLDTLLDMKLDEFLSTITVGEAAASLSQTAQDSVLTLRDLSKQVADTFLTETDKATDQVDGATDQAENVAENAADEAQKASTSAADQVNSWMSTLLMTMFDIPLLDSILVRKVSSADGTIVIGTPKDGVKYIKGLFPELDNVVEAVQPVMKVFLPDRERNSANEQTSEFLDLLEQYVNRTAEQDRLFGWNQTAEEVSLADIAAALNVGLDELYKSQACAANVTLAQVEAVFGTEFLNDEGVPESARNDRDELCKSIRESASIRLALAVLFTQENPQAGGSELVSLDILDTFKPRGSLSDVLTWIPSTTTLGDLFQANKAFDATLGTVSPDAFDWIVVGQDATIGDVLKKAGIDVPALVESVIASSPLLGIVGGLSFDVLLGYQTLNLTLPIEYSTLFSTSSEHAKVICLAQIADAKIRARLQASVEEYPDAGFFVWNHPFPASEKDNLYRQVYLAFLAVLFTLIPFCYNPACYGMHAVQERILNAKHLMFVSGLEYHTYWFACWTFDFLTYFIVASWAMFCFSVSGAIDFADETTSIAGGTICLFLLYGLSAIPQAYCLSFLFSDDATAQIIISLFNFLTGWMFVVAAFSLDIYGYKETSDQLRVFFRMFPAFSLGEGLIQATEVSIRRSILKIMDPLDVFAWEILGRNLVVLGVLSLIYFTLLVFIEYMSGNVRLNKSIEKVARSIAKFRRFRGRQSMIMPVQLKNKQPNDGNKGDDIAAKDIVPACNFSDDEDESDALQGMAGDLYKDAKNQGEVMPPEEAQKREILGENDSFKELDGGILRRMETGGTTGFEFEPSEDPTGKKKRKKKKKKYDSTFIFDEDTDVRQERRRVYRDEEKDSLRLLGIRKVFAGFLSGKKFVAVRSLSLGVHRGECFGFLGTNAAGKTTTMKMCTRDLFPSEGKILLHGKSIYSVDMRDIGYCPQFDALFPRLTAREHLFIYGQIKGVPETHLNAVIDKLLEACDITKYANIVSSAYSGGTKRKLSLAIALIGSPKVVLLDEPSAGVDPSARRKIWEIICSSLHDGRSIVLTTHSMEESEALCDRICIMSNGVMRCIGTPSHLKGRFSPGYELQIKARGSHECIAAIGHVQRTFPSATVTEQYGPQAKLSIPLEKTSLADLFGTVEINRKSWGLLSYGVSQAGLETVFMSIANKWNPAQQHSRIQKPRNRKQSSLKAMLSFSK